MPLNNTIKTAGAALLHMAFPHLCAGCGTDVLAQGRLLCTQCLDELPQTHFEQHAANPVAKIFWGRLPVRHATAQYFFSKGSLMQNLMHDLKYKGNKDLGLALGRLMGAQLAASNHFETIDALVPLPLHPEKEHKRGYNQALVLCNGIAETFVKPVLKNAVIRTHHTESQTKKSRVERWENIDGRFLVQNPEPVQHKHLLLVDDVVTTGATLEACGQQLLQVHGTTLSIATLCSAFD
jgi:ComF family protein